jgi:membrane-associated phospholipid phosphatase
MNTVNAISDAGDSVVLICLAALLVAMLWRYQSWKAASTLLLALVACAIVMVCLKLALIACGHTWNAGMVSPSGHASMSVAVYGALAVVAARQTRYRQQIAIALGSIALIAAIAISRVTLGAHSVAEVALGVLVGAAALSLFAVRYFSLVKRQMNVYLLGALSFATILILHGVHLPVESLIQELAFFGRTSAGVCVDG